MICLLVISFGTEKICLETFGSSYTQCFFKILKQHILIRTFYLQPRSPTVIQPIVADNDIPLDLTVPAILICFCFCWCIGPVGIYFAYKVIFF